MPPLGSRTIPIEPFGLEVDHNLSKSLSPAERISLKNLFYKHKLLHFRKQSLTRAEQFDVLEHIGPADRASPLDYVKPDDEVLGSKHLAFHSDMHFAPYPAEGVSLLALDVEEGATYTAFVDAEAAYRRLPSSLASKLDGLRVIRVATPGVDEDAVPYAIPPGMHSMERDLVMIHPETGERILYVARCSTSRIVGLNENDSGALLSEIYGYIYDEAHMLKHYWQSGDLLIWDNLALQHARPSIEGITRRKLQRATIATHDQTSQIPASYIAPVEAHKEDARPMFG